MNKGENEWRVNCAQWIDVTRQHGLCSAKNTILLENGNRVSPEKKPPLRPNWSKACKDFVAPMCEACLTFNTGLPVIYKSQRHEHLGMFAREFHMKSTMKTFPDIGLNFKKFGRK